MKKLAFLLLIAAFACTTETKTEDTVVQDLSLEELWSTDTTSLLTPESVIYDPNNEVVYVACINGVPPTAKDGDGYIAIMNIDGSIKNASWVTGMDAPKGMGICEGFLYVADITKIHKIEIATGKIVNSYEVEGSQFLNDIAIAPDHKVYISDSNTSTVYVLDGDEVTVVLQNDVLGGSNGLLVDEGKLLIAGFGSGAFHQMDIVSKELVAVTDSIFGGDGIVKYQDKYLVSNWNGEVYSVATNGVKRLLLDTKSAKRNAADIALINDSDVLLVPEFFANRVTAYRIK
ncbi:Sugar lactone lactonase YvrE [Spirosomataceae bacterium TFI 002]|nr:Sugar lactone lactonase YvrE [Spirosomataceae bacterium TFI 002]